MKKNSMRNLLIVTIIALTVCIGIFVWLLRYTSGQSTSSLNDLGDVYMTQIGTQVKLHFSTLIELQQARIKDLVDSMPDDILERDQAEIEEELSTEASSLGFSYLGFYNTQTGLTDVMGSVSTVQRDEDFYQQLLDGQTYMTDGTSTDGKTYYFLGIAYNFPMETGDESDILIVGLPEESIIDTLSLDLGDTQVYSYIIREDDTSFVLNYGDAQTDSYIDRIRLDTQEDPEQQEQVISEIMTAMQADESLSFSMSINGEIRNVYLTTLDNTDWYLVSALPYSLLREPIYNLISARSRVLVMGFGAILLIFLIVFAFYVRFSRQQMHALEESTAEAERANKAKSEFLSNMSHDIRTPINGIMGMLEVAEHYTNDPEQIRECLLKMHKASNHLLALINDVLDMSKMETGKLEVVQSPFDMRTVIDACNSIIVGQMEDRHISYTKEFVELKHPHVLGNALYVRRVIINILSNAVKYTDDGGGIRFRAEELESAASVPSGDSQQEFNTETSYDTRPTTSFKSSNPHDLVSSKSESSGKSQQSAERATFRFIVEDTGIGMSEEFLQHVFDDFAQENRGSRGGYQGTGLGLAITKRLVDLMGGTIDVQSEIGKGSTFTVTLSLPVDAHPAETVVSTDMRDLTGVHVLLAEDNELNMEITTQLLEMNGMVVTQAWNGREAVEKYLGAEPGTFDAILMDMQMPLLDGCGAAREIRASGRADAATIPILAVTANAFVEDMAATTAAGMNAHISKPIDYRRLCQVLGSLLFP